MNDIIFYSSYNIFCNSYNKDKLDEMPGGGNFSSFFNVFNQNISVMDRTETVKIPLKCELLPWLKLPKYEKFTKSFSEIMDERAVQVFKQAVESNRKLAVMYSGGVDSTAILCALLKNIPEKDLKDNVVVLLSELSIMENPNFYHSHIIKKFKCISSFRFPYFLGNDEYLLINGENADQLFGSQVTGFFTLDRDFKDVFKPVRTMRGELIDWMRTRIEKDWVVYKSNDKDYSEKLFNHLEQIVAAAPIELDDIYRFFWWINFTTKWQSVYVRLLPFSQNPKTIKLEENYTTFYYPKDFQLWSMNNTDKFVKDTALSSKYIAKEYICEYNKDWDYMNKPKIGSLSSVFKQKNIPTYITRDMEYHYGYPSADKFNRENDFR